MRRLGLKDQFSGVLNYFEKKYRDRKWTVIENHVAANDEKSIDALAITFMDEHSCISIQNPLSSTCGRFEFSPMEGDEPKDHVYYGLSKEDAIFMHHINEQLIKHARYDLLGKIKQKIVVPFYEVRDKVVVVSSNWEDIEKGGTAVTDSMGDLVNRLGEVFPMCLDEWHASFGSMIEEWVATINEKMQKLETELHPRIPEVKEADEDC